MLPPGGPSASVIAGGLVRDPTISRALDAVLIAVRTATAVIAKLEAIRDGAAALEPFGDDASDSIDHLSSAAIDLFDLHPDDVQIALVSGFKRSCKLRAEQPKPNDRQGTPPRFKLTPFHEIQISTAPAYLIKGFIPRGSLVIVWGPPKCGKSFWTFDLMMHVALGWRYRDRRVQQGPVVYLALEGGRGFRARVEAWRRHHLADNVSAVPFYLVDVPVNLVADHSALIKVIREQLGGETPVAMVIDTLNRALVGDENKSEDMAKFIRAADTIRSDFSCAVVIVHHCGVQGGRPRGHTSLSGADDAQIAIERDAADNIIAKVEHMKDGEAGGSTVSRLESVDLGTDDEGDKITSCVVVEAGSESGVLTKKAPTGAARVPCPP